MKTDKNGQMAGEVFIEDGVFRTGDNLLRITDSSLDNVAATVAVAETKWSAKGAGWRRSDLYFFEGSGRGDYRRPTLLPGRPASRPRRGHRTRPSGYLRRATG